MNPKEQTSLKFYSSYSFKEMHLQMLSNASILMTWYNTAVTPMLTHGSYCSLALSHWYYQTVLIQWWQKKPLNHCGPVMPYGKRDLNEHCLWQWLVAWWHQVITSTNVGLSSEAFCGIHSRAMSQELLMKLIGNMCSEITHWNYHHNEFIYIYFLKTTQLIKILNHWHLNKMADIMQTTFSNTFPSVKKFGFSLIKISNWMNEFRLKLH